MADTMYGDFPTIAVPAFLAGSGWFDNSWHNDVCPKSLYELNPQTDECLRVWVAEEKAEDREYPDGPRFTVEHVANEHQHLDGEAKVLYAGDSEAEAESAIKSFFANREVVPCT